MNYSLSVGLIISLFLASCSTPTTNLDANRNVVKAENLVELTGQWLKDGKGEVHFGIVLHNKAEKFLSIPFSEFVCFRGQDAGSVFKVVNSGHGIMSAARFAGIVGSEIRINPDEEKKLILVCSFQGVQKGPHKLVIKRIYERLSQVGDGLVVTPIVRNLEWVPDLTIP